MPVSEKQKRANKRNAKKSSGPITEEGKAISCRNATRHGLYSKDIVIDSPGLKENREEYENIVVALFKLRQFLRLIYQSCELTPRGTCARRIIRAETAHLHDLLKNSDPDDPSDKLNLRAIPEDYFSKLILRYEMRLDRQLSRYYRMLTHNQKIQQSL